MSERLPDLSVAIIAYNEARHIGACLHSLAALPAKKEVVVLLDTRTHDNTAAICTAHGARVVHEPWRGYAGQRNRALDVCQGSWVLFVDADERLTDALCRELSATLAVAPPDVAGYAIPRYNIFFGRRLRGGGWYPDYQLRLLRRSQARFDARQHVHERAVLGGTMGALREHFIHYNIESLPEFWHKQAAYALAEARSLQALGRRTRGRNFVGAPAREFWRRFVRLGGWRDGLLGLFLCGALAWFEMVKFACLLLLPPRSPHQPTS